MKKFVPAVTAGGFNFMIVCAEIGCSAAKELRSGSSRSNAVPISWYQRTRRQHEHFVPSVLAFCTECAWDGSIGGLYDVIAGG